MSSRNFRKIFGDRQNTLPSPADSDGDYEPLYTKNCGGSSFSRYQGLQLNSEGDSNGEKSPDSNDTDSDDASVLEDIQSVKKKKNNRKKRKRNKSQNAANPEAELDEVDKSVREVNKLLGEVELEDEPSTSSQASPEPSLMQVEAKHLNVNNEVKKKFGPEVLQNKDKKHGRQAQYMTRLLKKVQLVNMDEYLPLFKKADGLTMSINRREGPLSFFTFDHSREYQRSRAFLLAQKHNSGQYEEFLQVFVDQGWKVEALIEAADNLFSIEEYNSANKLIEQAVAYMRYVSHPSFNLCDMNTRLEYRYLENQPFFEAVLKYLYLITNKACHRTALELAKLLLNLDPSDPLAVILVIDTLALRAGEHQWLVKAIEKWVAERSAGYLYNIKYSYALALFHVTKKTGDTTEASKQLEIAFLNFPTCLMEILRFANHRPETRLKEHPFFNSWAMASTPINLRELITLYAKLSWSEWRDSAAMKWLIATAIGFVDKYDQDKELQEQAKRAVNQRGTLYQKIPDQMYRHLCVIKPMAELLVDNVMPSVVISLKPRGDIVDRYNYFPERPLMSTVSVLLQELTQLIGSTNELQ